MAPKLFRNFSTFSYLSCLRKTTASPFIRDHSRLNCDCFYPPDATYAILMVEGSLACRLLENGPRSIASFAFLGGKVSHCSKSSVVSLVQFEI